MRHLSKREENARLLKECGRIFERFDTIEGTVVNFDHNGCFVHSPEIGADFYYYGPGCKGDFVRLGIKSINEKTGRITCVLETVLEYGEFVA